MSSYQNWVVQFLCETDNLIASKAKEAGDAATEAQAELKRTIETSLSDYFTFRSIDSPHADLFRRLSHILTCSVIVDADGHVHLSNSGWDCVKAAQNAGLLGHHIRHAGTDIDLSGGKVQLQGKLAVEEEKVKAKSKTAKEWRKKRLLNQRGPEAAAWWRRIINH